MTRNTRSRAAANNVVGGDPPEGGTPSTPLLGNTADDRTQTRGDISPREGTQVGIGDHGAVVPDTGLQNDDAGPAGGALDDGARMGTHRRPEVRVESPWEETTRYEQEQTARREGLSAIRGMVDAYEKDLEQLRGFLDSVAARMGHIDRAMQAAIRGEAPSPMSGGNPDHGSNQLSEHGQEDDDDIDPDLYAEAVGVRRNVGESDENLARRIAAQVRLNNGRRAREQAAFGDTPEEPAGTDADRWRTGVPG